MPNEPQVIVPKPEWRKAVRALYEAALSGVKVTPVDITVHLDSSATVKVATEADYARMANIPGAMFLSDLSAKNNVKLVIPEALEYLGSNSPVLTDEERAQRKQSSGQPMTEARRLELETRRRNKTMLADALAAWGITARDADEPEPGDESDE